MKQKKAQITIGSSVTEYLTHVATIEDENVWLTQKMMGTLYDVDVRIINEHITKSYFDSELVEDAIIRNFWIVQSEDSRQLRDT